MKVKRQQYEQKRRDKIAHGFQSLREFMEGELGVTHIDSNTQALTEAEKTLRTLSAALARAPHASLAALFYHRPLAHRTSLLFSCCPPSSGKRWVWQTWHLQALVPPSCGFIFIFAAFSSAQRASQNLRFWSSTSTYSMPLFLFLEFLYAISLDLAPKASLRLPRVLSSLPSRQISLTISSINNCFAECAAASVEPHAASNGRPRCADVGVACSQVSLLRARQPTPRFTSTKNISYSV